MFAFIVLCLSSSCGGNDAPVDGPSDGPVDGGLLLHFDLAGAFRVIDPPHADEGGGLVSTLSVWLPTHELATSAALTVNGVSVPGDGSGHFHVSAANGLNIGPESRVEIVATHGSQRVSETFTCPKDVTLTAPAENANVRFGEQLSATWTLAGGDPLTPWAGLILAEYNFAARRNVHVLIPNDAERYRQVDKRGLQATLTVPPYLPPFSPSQPTSDGYSVELWAPGERGLGDGFCTLVRRAHVHVD